MRPTNIGLLVVKSPKGYYKYWENTTDSVRKYPLIIV